MQSLSLLSILNKSAYLVFKKQTKGHFHLCFIRIGTCEDIADQWEIQPIW